jgi:hypothetical protein
MDSECALWEYCVSSTCRRPPQICVSQCSGHGECFFRDINTGSTVNECFVGDSSCVALCRCASGWSGSACSLDEVEYEIKLNLRALLVSNLQSLYSQEDLSEDTLNTYVSSLGTITQNSDEISLHTAQTVLEMSLSLLGDAQRSNIPFAAVSDILSSVNSAVSATLVFSASDNRDRRRVTDVNPLVSDILDLCSSSASGSISQGEPPITSYHNLFRLAVSVPPISTDDTKGLTFVTPLTPSEDISNMVPSSLTFNRNSVAAQRRLSDTSFAFGVSSTKAQLFGDESLTCDSLRFHYSSEVMDASSHPSVIFTLRNFAEQSYYTINEPLSFNLTCADDDYSSHNYTCPIGPRETKVFTFHCKGFLADYSFTCPIVAFEPACEQPHLGMDANQLFNCSVISYDSWWTTCECILISSDRRVLSVLATTGALEVAFSNLLCCCH